MSSRPETGTADIDAALARARRPPTAPPMPTASLRVTLGTSPRLRRLIPARLVVRRALRRAQRSWRDHAPTREDALGAIDVVIAGTSRAGEREALARQHVIERETARAMFWQPQTWRAPRKLASSDGHLRAAEADGRGVLVSYCHLGLIGPAHGAVCAPGRDVYSTAGAWFFAPPSNDAWGRRIAFWSEQARARGQRVLPAAGSFQVLQALLADGDWALVQFDVPGSQRTPFLGKPVMLTSGTARLAHGSGALVLPMRTRRAGHRLQLDLAAPLDPREHADHLELHLALAAVHERWILEEPASLEDPRRAGAWERGATATGWSRASA